MDNFEKNSALFEHRNPRAAALLSCVDPSFWQPCQTVRGEPNLQKATVFLHSQKGALDEACRWVDTLHSSDIDVLVVFGVGLGYIRQALSGWLSEKPHRKLVFLEDDLGILFRFLQVDSAYELLSDPQVHLYYLEESAEGVEVLKGLSWATFGKKMEFVASPSYALLRREQFERIKERLLFEQSDIHAVCDEYTNYGISYFRNFWRNLFLLDGSRVGNGLKGQFAGMPAIVVAAGPSLQGQMDLLMSARSKAILFAGGSAVNALTEAGVMPHFGIGIDPNPLQYMRLRQNLALQVPFFYRSRMLHEACALIPGDRLYLRGGDGYGIAEYFERVGKISGTVLGGGHSVANFGIEIAYALGCSPIILVGFDLAYGASLERYAPGIEESHPSSKRAGLEDEVIDWKTADGRVVQTAWKWIQEGQWIEEFTKKHGKKRFINATSGGLGISGISQMSLAEVAEKYLARSYDVDALVHQAVQETTVCQLPYKRLLQKMAKMYDSLSHCITALDAILRYVSDAQLEVAIEEVPEVLLLQEQLHKEAAFGAILEVFDRMKTKFDFYAKEFYPSSKVELELFGKRHFFLKEVCIVNQTIIHKAVIEQQARGMDISFFRPKTAKGALYA